MSVGVVVVLIAGGTVYLVHDNNIEQAERSVFQHLLKCGPVVIRARHSFILVFFDNGIILLAAVFAGKAELRRDRFRPLVVARIPRINYNIHLDHLTQSGQYLSNSLSSGLLSRK